MSLKELDEGSVVADIVVAVAWDGDPLDVAAIVAAKPNRTELKFEEAIVVVVTAAVAIVGEAVAVVGEGPEWPGGPSERLCARRSALIKGRL